MGWWVCGRMGAWGSIASHFYFCNLPINHRRGPYILSNLQYQACELIALSLLGGIVGLIGCGAISRSPAGPNLKHTALPGRRVWNLGPGTYMRQGSRFLPPLSRDCAPLRVRPDSPLSLSRPRRPGRHSRTMPLTICSSRGPRRPTTTEERGSARRRCP